MYEKIRLVAARIRELNRTEPPSLPESRLPVILSLSPWRKRVGSMGKEGEEKKIGWKRRGRNVDGERLATLGKECTHISHNFPRKFPPLRASFSLNSFLSTLARVSTSACGTRFVSAASLSLLLLSFRWLCFCSALVLHSSFRRLHRPRLER